MSPEEMSPEELDRALTTALTTALTARAELIDPQHLRFHELRRPRRGVPARWRPVLVAGCVLLVIAATGLLARGLPGAGGVRRTTTASAAYVGPTWRLESVEHDGTTVPIPTSLGVTLVLGRDGRFGANDSVNYLSGSYQPTESGFTTRDVGTTLAGYGGTDPAVLTAIAAVQALAYTPTGSGTLAPGTAVRARVDGDRLVLEAGGYRSTFARS
jgi:hypothetical protein